MKLSFEWPEATRPADVQTQVKTTARDIMLDLAGSPENALKAFERHRARPQPGDDWTRFLAAAFREATKPLTPTEQRLARLIPRWD